MNKVYIPIADKHFQDMLKANETVPYNHKEYTRHLNMARAACLLLCEGDYLQAAYLVDAFHESCESMAYYIEHLTYLELVDFARLPHSMNLVPHQIQIQSS